MTEKHSHTYNRKPPPDTAQGGFGFIPNGIREKNIFFYHPDHLGSSSYITGQDGKVSQHTEYIAFGEILFDEHNTEHTMPYLFNGKELDQETGLYYYGARYYDPKVSIFVNVDPLVEKTMQPYAYANNNPVMRVDPDGRIDDWVEKANGDIYWDNKATSQDTTKPGEIYRGKYYERTKEWNNSKHKGLVLEIYHTYKKMRYSPVKVATINIEGAMRNSKLGDVTVDINVTFENDKTKTIGSYTAVAGGFGNGAPENGEYTVDTYWNREPGKGNYSKGMNKHGIGFSFFLNPQFSTGRSELRIHPDGNNEGTQGCIGLCGNSDALKDFRDKTNYFLKTQKSIPTNINIINNPNNNGRKTKFKNNGE